MLVRVTKLVSRYVNGLLTDNNFYQHVASDIGIDQKYLPATNYTTQDSLNYVFSKLDQRQSNEVK